MLCFSEIRSFIVPFTVPSKFSFWCLVFKMVGFVYKEYDRWEDALAAVENAMPHMVAYAAETHWARHHARGLQTLALEALQKDSKAYFVLAEHAAAAWKIMPRYCDALRALQKRLQQVKDRLPEGIKPRLEERAIALHGDSLQGLEEDVARVAEWLEKAESTGRIQRLHFSYHPQDQLEVHFGGFRRPIFVSLAAILGSTLLQNQSKHCPIAAMMGLHDAALGRPRCHGRTLKGLPCLRKAVEQPSRAYYMYCHDHLKRWKEFEPRARAASQVMIDGTGNKQLKDLPDPPAGQGDSKIFTGDTAFLHLLLGRSFHRSIQSLANSEDSKADDGSKRIKLHCQSFGEARC
eukprot:symbB.v1.2.037626.t1/scaffold5607.1/size25383/3